MEHLFSRIYVQANETYNSAAFWTVNIGDPEKRSLSTKQKYQFRIAYYSKSILKLPIFHAT